MRIVSIKLNDMAIANIQLGFVGEDNATQVIFESESVFNDHPDAVQLLAVTPPEGTTYEVTTTRIGDNVVWNVSDLDTAFKGEGSLQLTFTDDSHVIKTYNAATTILESQVPSGTAPDSVLNWIEDAEAWAVGKRGGKSVEDEDPAYHNNSKYYSEQAEIAKTSAESAKDDAVSAKTDAETAKTAAEAAQAAAETAAERDVESWLEENFTNPDSPPLDRTLALDTCAAPADMVGNLKSAINGGTEHNYTSGKNINSSTGAIEDATGVCVSDKIPYSWTGATVYYCGDNTQTIYGVAFYDSSDNLIKYFRNPYQTGGNAYREINAETQSVTGCSYVRISFKSGTTGKVTNNNGQTTYWESGNIQITGLIEKVSDLQDDVEALQETAPEAGELDAIESTLETCVTFEQWSLITLDPTDNKLRDNTTFELTSSTGFNTAIVAVTAGEKYKITFWSNTTNYAPAWWSDSALISVIPDASVAGGIVVTAPEGATQLILNGRKGVSDLSAYENVQLTASKEFFNSLNKLTPKLGVAVTSTNVQIFQHGIVEGYDIMTLYTHKAMNNLLDVNGWYKVPNNTDIVSTSHDPFTRVSILHGSTDFIQPFMIWAVNNGNGDFTDPTVRKFTGGWHGYDSKTSGDYSATARTTAIKVLCDGREVESGNSDTGDTIILEITNRIQASNTEKEDGSGREVLEAKYVITYHSGFERFDIACTLKALEEININRMYGIALYRSGTSEECRAIGSRNHREAFNFSQAINFDQYTKGILVHCTNGDVEMGIDPLVDLGSGYANENGKGATCGNSKAYMVMIYDDTFTAENGLNLKTGDEARWIGYYKVSEVV